MIQVGRNFLLIQKIIVRQTSACSLSEGMPRMRLSRQAGFRKEREINYKLLDAYLLKSKNLIDGYDLFNIKQRKKLLRDFISILKPRNIIPAHGTKEMKDALADLDHQVVTVDVVANHDHEEAFERDGHTEEQCEQNPPHKSATGFHDPQNAHLHDLPLT